MGIAIGKSEWSERIEIWIKVHQRYRELGRSAKCDHIKSSSYQQAIRIQEDSNKNIKF